MTADWLKQLRATLGDELSVEALDRFVSLRRSCQELRRYVWKTATEAIVWLAAVGGAVAASMALLVPDLAEMYDAAGLAGSYRGATRVVIAAAKISPRWWLLVLVACLFAGLWPLVRRPMSVELLRGWPIFGPLQELIDRAEWSGMLGLMLAGGAAPHNALAQLAEFLQGTAWGTLSRAWASQLEAGQTLSEVARGSAGLLPATWQCLLDEDGGGYAQSLTLISGMSEAQARIRLTLLRAALRPVVVLLLVPPGILLLQAVCGPILTYLRTWN